MHTNNARHDEGSGDVPRPSRLEELGLHDFGPPVVPESVSEPSSDSEPAGDIEPASNPDGKERLVEEILEAPHAATRFDAGTGQGTVTGPPYGQKLQERPILDGSTQSHLTEATVPNPNRGESDPALVTHQPALNSTNTNRWLYSAVGAAALLSTVLLLLLQWNPLWCGIGVTVALVGVLAMLVVRASNIGLRARLRMDAVLLAVIWLVPLAIIVSVLITSADEIW